MTQTTLFGQVATAMITPFTAQGELDVAGAQQLAAHLVQLGSDALVVSGTTGESPTTTDAEKSTLIRAVVEAVGDKARIIAGAGSNNTAHSVELARAAEKSGAHGLLLVTPYYNRPPQAGLLAHFRTVADATDLPVMLYDIPARSGVPIEVETLVRLAEHPRIAAVKDAKGDLSAGSWVMARSDLAYYSGDDAMNLPWLSVGATGFVSVVAHLVADRLQEMRTAFFAGDVVAAAAMHQRLMPIYTGVFRTQGVITVKAALNTLGVSAGPVRAPLVDASATELNTLRADLHAGGFELPPV